MGRKNRPAKSAYDSEPESGFDEDGVFPTSHATARIESDPSRTGGRLLYLDGVVCSYINLDDPSHLEFGYIKRFADVINLIAEPTAPLRITHLGGGGFTLPGYVADSRPRSQQVVYEYDAALVELARTELGLFTRPGMKVKVGDARMRLEHRSPDSADVIIGDAFVGRKVPRHLSTVEFVQLVHTVLVPGGVYCLNVIGGPDLHEAREHAAALLAVFGSVVVTSDPDVLSGKASGNLVFVASDATLPVDALRRRVSRGALPEKLLDPDAVRAFAGSTVARRDPG